MDPVGRREIALELLFLAVAIVGLVIRLTGPIWSDALIVIGAIGVMVVHLLRRRRLRASG